MLKLERSVVHRQKSVRRGQFTLEVTNQKRLLLLVTPLNSRLWEVDADNLEFCNSELSADSIICIVDAKDRT